LGEMGGKPAPKWGDAKKRKGRFFGGNSGTKKGAETKEREKHKTTRSKKNTKTTTEVRGRPFIGKDWWGGEVLKA